MQPQTALTNFTNLYAIAGSRAPDYPQNMQLELFDHIGKAQPTIEERWQYPLVTLFNGGGSSDLYYITARSKQEAIAIAEGILNSKRVPFKAVASLQGTYWRRSIHGYPCNPIDKANKWI